MLKVQRRERNRAAGLKVKMEFLDELWLSCFEEANTMLRSLRRHSRSIGPFLQLSYGFGFVTEANVLIASIDAFLRSEGVVMTIHGAGANGESKRSARAILLKLSCDTSLVHLWLGHNGLAEVRSELRVVTYSDNEKLVHCLLI